MPCKLTAALRRAIGLTAIVGSAWLAPVCSHAADGRFLTRVSPDQYVAAAKARLAAHPSSDPLENARTLRRFVFQNLLYAGTPEGWIGDDKIQYGTKTLEDALRLTDRSDKGVWCTASAIILARLYTELGYKASVVSWGAAKNLTHSETLIDINGRLYMEDAYFNFDYTDAAGKPMPYLDVLKSMTLGKPPTIRQDLDERLGIFANPRQAAEYVPLERQSEITCRNVQGTNLCDLVMTVGRFAYSWYQKDAVEEVLASYGLPAHHPEMLSLFPVWASKDTPAGGAGEPDAALVEQMKAITHCASDGAVLTCDPKFRKYVKYVAPDYSTFKGWRQLDTAWISLMPSNPIDGQLPLTFAVPSRAWDYGASSKVITASADSIIEVKIKAQAGRIGVSLCKPDGSALVSKEQVITPETGEATLFFHLTPAQGPVIVLARNYDQEGVAGKVSVERVRMAAEATLTQAELAEVKRVQGS